MILHDMSCSGGVHSDAAKRVSAEWTMHRLADPHGSIGKWLAVALSDGDCDHVPYPSKNEAVTHQHHNEQWYAYLQIRPCGMSVCDAEIFLRVQRKMYDAGIRMTDPDTVRMPEPIKRASREDQVSQLRTMFTRGKSRPSNLIIGGK